MLHALAAEQTAREVWWLHGARNGNSHPFAIEARTLLNSLANGRAHIAFSSPGQDDVESRDYDTTGYLSPALLATLDLPRNADAYICGPPAFMSDTSAALAALGLDPTHIHVEYFGTEPGQTPGIDTAPTRSPHMPTGTPGTGPTIEFARSNLAVPWSPEYASVLELAEACDVPVRWSCRTGVCHTCETAVVSGTLEYDPDPVEAPRRRVDAHLLRAALPRDGGRRRSRRCVRVVGRGRGARDEAARQGIDGDMASVTVSVSPRARCTIGVYYSTTASRAAGLGAKRGTKITWTWRVGSNTKPGMWPVKIDCGKSGKTQTSVTVRP